MSEGTTPRGSVLVARRAIGFARTEPRRYLVLQSTALSAALATLVVAPIDDAGPTYAGDPYALRLDARESGTGRAGVALLDLIGAIPRDRFEPEARASVRRSTLIRVDELLVQLLEIRFHTALR